MVTCLTLRPSGQEDTPEGTGSCPPPAQSPSSRVPLVACPTAAERVLRWLPHVPPAPSSAGTGHTLKAGVDELHTHWVHVFTRPLPAHACRRTHAHCSHTCAARALPPGPHPRSVHLSRAQAADHCCHTLVTPLLGCPSVRSLLQQVVAWEVTVLSSRCPGAQPSLLHPEAPICPERRTGEGGPGHVQLLPRDSA